MPSIRERLGDWGKKVIDLSQQLQRTLGETLGILQPIAPEIEPVAAAKDWGKASLEKSLTPSIATVPDDQFIAHTDYVESEVPWKSKYAYEVTAYGRDLATGRFANWQLNITMNTELDVGQIKREAIDRLGQGGISAIMDIWSMEVTGAYHSPEVSF